MAAPEADRPEDLRVFTGDGDRAYVEWPSPNFLNSPSRNALIYAGVELTILEFNEHDMHSAALTDRAAMCSAFRENGLEIEQEGVIRLPWVEKRLIASQRNSTDRFRASGFG